MKLLKNKKGMTLVEIVVVLLIMSILLVIMGSLILNAFSYFNKTTDQDINKRALDSISEYVRSELLYASDVRVQEEKPNDEEWNTLYIVDGKLYKDDEQVFSNNFYNKNNLVLKLRGFDQYRLDLNYSFKDMDKANAYSTKDTLELLNLKIKIESDSEFNPFNNISTVTTVSDKVKIYYQKSIKVTEEEKPINPDEGTVAELMNCLNFHNNRMDFNPNFGNGVVKYRLGDMVFYEGYWWQLCEESGLWENDKPGSTGHVWKKISGEFDESSCYTVGDIIYIRENDKILYFKCKRNCINYTKTPKPNINRPYDDWSNFWEQCEKPEKLTLSCLPYTQAYNSDEGKSVIYKILNYLNENNLTLDDIPVFDEDSVNNHKQGSFVKIWDEEKSIYRYFMKLDNGQENENRPGEQPGNNNKLIWQEMKIDWDEYSGYETDDVVCVKEKGYYQALWNEQKYGPNLTNVEDSKLWKKLNEY